MAWIWPGLLEGCLRVVLWWGTKSRSVLLPALGAVVVVVVMDSLMTIRICLRIGTTWNISCLSCG
jgi:hypothetical protein